MVKKLVALMLVLTMAAVMASCAAQTKQQKGTGVGAAVGAATGAVLGQAIGRDRQATLWGAAIGAAVGGIAGNQIGAYMDRQEQDLRNAMAASQQADEAQAVQSIQRDQDVLTATFKSDVFFAVDSATLMPGAMPELDRVAEVLNRYPETTIRIEGHTDSTGSEQHNQILSEKRAQSVANALIQRNVYAQRITTIGFGESQPISSNNAMNRRVNIVITPVRQG